MAQLIDPTPILPRAFQNAPTTLSLSKYDAQLNQALYNALIRIAHRLNLALIKDGSEPMTGPLTLASFNVADVPDEATWAGSLIYVPDETGGPTVAYSNGTDWKRVYDNATVS